MPEKYDDKLGGANGRAGPPSTSLSICHSDQQAGAVIEQPVPSHGNEANSTRRRSAESDVPWPFGSDSSVGGEGIGPGVDYRQQGYPKVAAFEDCDPSLLIYRKFGWLHNRVLLSEQDELAELEGKLKRLDAWEFASGDYKRLLSQRRDFQQEPFVRQEMITKIKAKLAQYDELLLRVQKIQSIKRPSARAQTTLFNLIKNTESLVADESEWIRYSLDLASLAQDAEHGWFNGFLEDSLNTISRRLTQVSRVGFSFSGLPEPSFSWFPRVLQLLSLRDSPLGCHIWERSLAGFQRKVHQLTCPDETQAIFRNGEQARQVGTEQFQLLTPARMDIFLRVVLTVLASVLLLVPVFILFELQPSHPSEVRRKSNYQILTIFFFTLLFAASCSIFTRARRQEVFQATAAYSAVLVIFLGNTSNVVVATNGLLDVNAN
ncbi:MAG: hypothetical protein Q9163_004260 [Psora crenata]